MTDTSLMLDGLASEERGLVLGLNLLCVGDPPALPLEGERRSDVVLAWQSLCAQPVEARAALQARLQDEIARFPVSALARLHPTWIVDAVMGQPVALQAILVQGLPAAFAALFDDDAGGREALSPTAQAPDEAGVRELQRCTFSELSPLLVEPCGPLGGELCALDFSALVTRAVKEGAWEVGRSLAKAPSAVVARAMATVGGPWAQDLAQAAHQPASPEQFSRAAALVEAASGVRSGSPGEWRTVDHLRPEDRLAAVGLLSLRDSLAAEGHASLCAVAGRLPMALGRTWLEW